MHSFLSCILTNSWIKTVGISQTKVMGKMYHGILESGIGEDAVDAKKKIDCRPRLFVTIEYSQQ